MFSEEELKHFYDKDTKTFIEDYKKLTDEEKKKIRLYSYESVELKMTSFCTK